MKGTLLNTTTVGIGSIVGLVLGRGIPAEAQQIALTGLGLLSLGVGIKQFFESKNILIVAIAIALGGVIGLALGIQNGINHLGDTLKATLGGEGTFTEGFVTAVILFCVGPMTIMGCIQDGLEGKSELLSLKSTMDGVASVFLAATLGAGVLVSAAFILVFQGLITILAKRLRFLKEDPAILAEFTAVGGLIMMAIAFSLLEIKKIPSANFFPALLLAPLFVGLADILKKRFV